jgi:thiamine phosphate synthase YjbQ (UPF0047 family)
MRSTSQASPPRQQRASGVTRAEVWLEKLGPHEPTAHYQHTRAGEDNADAHLKRQVMSRDVVVAITKGKLDFGAWEKIFYGEFDGKGRSG